MMIDRLYLDGLTLSIEAVHRDLHRPSTKASLGALIDALEETHRFLLRLREGEILLTEMRAGDDELIERLTTLRKDQLALGVGELAQIADDAICAIQTEKQLRANAERMIDTLRAKLRDRS
jgi:hypothetical protein